MRINKYVAQSTALSRRAADTAIEEGRILVNGVLPTPGQHIAETDRVTVDGKPITPPKHHQTILLNKPIDYVCSRDGQGSKTIYELLPKEYQHLNSVGRLDKNSSGLLLLTDDGQLAQELAHPSHQKEKIYEIRLDHELTPEDFETITKKGVGLEDGLSKFALDYINDDNFEWKVTMKEGRNRQIRRTFDALGYTVTKLHRTHFGNYRLDELELGGTKEV